MSKICACCVASGLLTDFTAQFGTFTMSQLKFYYSTKFFTNLVKNTHVYPLNQQTLFLNTYSNTRYFVVSATKLGGVRDLCKTMSDPKGNRLRRFEGRIVWMIARSGLLRPSRKIYFQPYVNPHSCSKSQLLNFWLL